MYIQGHKGHFVMAVPGQAKASHMSTTHDHVGTFQNLVKYLVKLRRDGDIDNDTFGKLVQQVSASFVETEVSERVDRVLGSKLSLDRLLEIL